MWYVYLLRCSDSTLYCGMSSDIEKRVATHNAGKGARYTRARLPVTLLYKESVKNISEALRRERAIKKLTRAQKEKLISKDIMVAVAQW
jgi:predicted GIY-YIG superfamily endonuclease